MSNDVHTISARVKNLIAKEDIALSPVGKVLVNYFTLVLKNLYDFSETLPEPHKQRLNEVIGRTEDMPLLVIKVSTPKEQPKTLYEQVISSKPEFVSNEEALKHFEEEYRYLGSLYGVTGDELWFQAESGQLSGPDSDEIRRLKRSVTMCQYLIEKDS
jgi:hypothetical protein